MTLKWCVYLADNHPLFDYSLGKWQKKASLFSFSCDYCEKKFGCQTGLASHLNGIHLHKKFYRCHICLKDFKFQSNMRRHVQTQHWRHQNICSTTRYRSQSPGMPNHCSEDKNPSLKNPLCQINYVEVMLAIKIWKMYFSFICRRPLKGWKSLIKAHYSKKKCGSWISLKNETDSNINWNHWIIHLFKIIEILMKWQNI